MGTNYYVKTGIFGICPTCKRDGHEVVLHLGKYSADWKFTLQLNGKKYYSNFEEMKEFLKGKQIIDEYDDPVTLEEFVSLVESQQDCDESWYWVNHSDTNIYIKGYKFKDCEFC